MSDIIIEKNTGTFEIRIKGGKRYTLPAWDNLPASLTVKAAKAQRKGEEADAGFVLFDFIDERCPGLMDQVSESQLGDIVKAWRGEAVELGE